MPLEQQSQIYHFSLLFQSVKMKVKFPCKLSLEHLGNVITNQVSAKQQNKFLINEEVLIKDQSDKKFVEIVVNLITEKGSKYIAGIIKLFHNQLLRSDGQRIVVALGKCLDPEAFCEVKVEKVVTQKVTKRNPVFGGSRVGREEQSFSPAQNQANFKSATNLGNGLGTRSQAQFNINPIKNATKQWQQKRETCAMTYYPKNRPSPPRTRRKIGDTSKVKLQSNMKIREDEENTNRQKLIEAEVYKENYVKLKEKYRKQSQNYKVELNKRIALQNNENNYKLEIVRLRLKCQQLQKAYNDKNLRMKQLQGQLAMLQQKDIDIGYYRQETANLKNTIAMLEDTIITLNTQNDKLKELNKQREHQYETKMNQLQAEYERVRQMYEAKECEYERDMRVMKEELIQVEYELNSKTQMLQKEKNYIFEFEKSSQAKLFEFDTMLQNQRNNSRVKYEDLKMKFQKLQLQNKQLLNDKKQLQAQRQTHRSYVMKTEYQYKLHVQQINTIKNELQQLHSLRDKHQKLILQHKSLKEEKQFSTKNFDKLIKNKDLSFEEIVNENKKQIQFIKRINLELGEKNKSLIQKGIEYEGLIEGLKNTVEKNRRALEMVTKDFTELKQKEKLLKKSLSQKQQLLDEFKDKLQKANTKQSNILDTKRTQTDKFNQIITKLKHDLQNESSKLTKLTQTNSELNHELSRIKMMLQFSQEKVEKNSISAQEKYKSYEAIINEHEGVISMLEENINEIKVKENQLFSKYSQLQNEHSYLKEQNEKLNRQHRILGEKLTSVQSINKQKALQLSALVSKHEASQKRNQDLQNQVHQVKTQLSLIKGQKQKTLKLLQISNGQNQKCRQTIIKFSADLFEKQSRMDAKNKQISKLQQELEKANYKGESLARDYAKFRQSFGEMMSSSMKQFEVLKHETLALVSNMGINEGRTGTGREYNSFNNNDWQNRFSANSYGPMSANMQNERKRKFSTELNSKSFNDIAAFTSEIMNTFSTYTKQNQSTLTRLIQRNKILNKQLQSTRNQLSQQVAHNQQLQYESQKQKEQIEEELREITHQKGSQSIKLNSLLEQIKQQLYDKQQLLEEAHSQIDELQFTLSSNKMDYDASINEIDKKNYQLKQFIEEIQEKNEFQHNVISSLQQKCYELDKEIIDLKNGIIAEKQLSYKRQSQIMEGLHEIKHLQQLIQAQKQKQNKLLETVSNLQVQLATQKQTRSKLQKTLLEEEDKKRQLKAFSANIIKEKQTIIKQELQHHQKLSQLENKLIEHEHHKQLLLEEIQLIKAEALAHKQQIKKLQQTIKESQTNLSQQKAKLLDAQKVIKEKQKTIHEQQTSLKQLTKKHQLTINQHKKSLQQLNEQISFMANHKQKLTQDLNQKLSINDKQLKAYESIVNQQKLQLQELQQHLYAYKEKSRALEQSLINKEHQVNELRYKAEHLQALKGDLQQDCKDKEENMYELSATIYELQSRIGQLVRQKQQEVQEVNNQWNLKYQDLYQELQQRFQLLQKQKQYLKQQILQKQNELNKKLQDKKTLQSESSTHKKLLQDKIKKLQEQRLLLLTTKNNELHKLSEQLKDLLDKDKRKESEHRKTTHELQIARNQILKLDNRLLQMDNKIKSMNKMYQQEIQDMKKKQSAYKAFKQEIVNKEWTMQREVRKVLQTFVKGMLAMGDQTRDKSQLMQLVKGLQTGVLALVKIVDDKN